MFGITHQALERRLDFSIFFPSSSRSKATGRRTLHNQENGAGGRGAREGGRRREAASLGPARACPRPGRRAPSPVSPPRRQPAGVVADDGFPSGLLTGICDAGCYGDPLWGFSCRDGVSGPGCECLHASPGEGLVSPSPPGHAMTSMSTSMGVVASMR